MRVCDPSIHHPSTRSSGSSKPTKVEPENTGCGMKFRHEVPIRRVDGVWQGKDVDDIEVKDPRLDMEKTLREKGAGSKKNAYKGLYQVEPYEVSSTEEYLYPDNPAVC